jgi:hypothetical protein
MIEHSIRGKVTDISSLRNGLMDGKLLNYEGNTVKRFDNTTRVRRKFYFIFSTTAFFYHNYS